MDHKLCWSEGKKGEDFAMIDMSYGYLNGV